MNHIFFRIYLGIVLSVLIAIIISSAVNRFSEKPSHLQEAQKLLQSALTHLVYDLGNLNEKALGYWFEEHHKISDFPISLQTLYAFSLSEQQKQALIKGEVIILDDEAPSSHTMLAKLPNSDYLIKVGPIFTEHASHSAFSTTFFVSILSQLLIIGLAVFYLVHPIEVRLGQLEKTTNKFARGDLNVRATATGKDAVGRLEETFNNMADRIELLIRAQQELTNAVSHELRTPIARIRFALEMLSMATTHEEQESRLQEMDNDLTDLDQLIDELLTYARLGAAAPPIRFEQVNTHNVFDIVCRGFENIYPQINYEYPLDPGTNYEANAEPRYLQRAVQNLVGNASRYAESTVKVTYETQQNENIIYVDDDGPGISIEDRERVFSPFARLDDSRTRSTGGYGLGLAIVSRIVRWHKGKIWIEDSPLGGARFIINWPKQPTS